jgi:RNA recognition motif-containing protein
VVPSSFLEIYCSKIVKDGKKEPRTHAFSFVTMVTEEGARKAIAELDGKEFLGKPIIIKVRAD